ncbi:hypothetical protein ACS0TY_005578 [Phlomoides rotata]
MAEYGRQTDEYGNPLPRPGGTGGVTGTHGAHDGGGIVGGIHQGRPVEKKGMVEKVKEKLPGGGNKGEQMAHGTGAHGTHGGGVTGTHGAHDGGLHRRSGSSSSSSSEDDGLGGRRKKGVKEKIKEKLPGGGNKGEQMHPATTTGVYDQGRPAEKKGMVEKIKEKLPGGGNKGEQMHPATTTGVYDQGEKKGMVEKIKEKLPGQGGHQ